MSLTAVTREMVAADIEGRIRSIQATVENTKAEAEAIRRDNHCLRVTLLEAKLAIEFLHDKSWPTGYSASVLQKIEAALAE
jgi:hypothetical protein